MKIVIDANILFSLAKSTSSIYELVEKENLTLIAPEFALLELKKYKNEILKKSNIKDFKKILSIWEEKVIFIEIDEYKKELKKAKKLIPDPKDITYLALALRFSVPIWSNDSHFKEQDEIPVFNTREIIKLLI